jgi:hypothetical protein
MLTTRPAPTVALNEGVEQRFNSRVVLKIAISTVSERPLIALDLTVCCSVFDTLHRNPDNPVASEVGRVISRSFRYLN